MPNAPDPPPCGGPPAPPELGAAPPTGRPVAVPPPRRRLADLPPPTGQPLQVGPRPTAVPRSPSAEATSDGPPVPPGPAPDGSPPPPGRGRLPSDDDTPRATAATWVAATGALLLLVAAGTFLAVSWEVLGITARVAVVGSVTATAIVGGHLLRRVVPAVGAVVFHLGALLLPIDAVGLALQLDLGPAEAWLLAGAVSVLALPPLAIAGRSRVLASAAIVGVPVLATGLGLADVVDPSLAVVVAAVLGLAALPLRGTRITGVWHAAPASLVVLAVHVPLVAVVLDLALVDGQLAHQVQAAGWAPTSWVQPLIVGSVGVAVVAVCARHRRSSALAVLVPVLIAVSGLVAVLPPGTPRLAVLLVLPVVALLVETLAVGLADDPTWSPPLHWAAGAMELLGAAMLLPAAVIIVAPGAVLGTAADPELAAAFAVAVLAWGLAAWRWRSTDAGRNVAVPFALNAAVLFLAASAALILPGERSPLAAALVVAAAGLAALRTLAAGWAQESGRPVRRDAPAVAALATTSIVIGCAAAWSTELVLPIAAVAAPLIAFHVRGLVQVGDVPAIAVASVALPIGVATTPLLALLSGSAGAPSAVTPWLGGSWSGGAALPVLITVVGLLGMAAIVQRLDVIADLIRGSVALVALVAVGVSAVPGGLLAAVQSGVQSVAVEVLRPAPSMLVALAVAVVWLLTDAVRLRRSILATLAAPLVVRLAATVVVVADGGPIEMGAALLVVALVGAVIAFVGPSAVVLPASATTLLAAVPGWALVAATPEIRAWSLVAVGMLLVTAGLVRRQAVIGYLGAVVATLGSWQLFAIHQVLEVDLWLVPVAGMLTVAGARSRRDRTLSSWITDVPPLLLVATPGIAERLAGGDGYHALLAGGLALVAVIYGGSEGRGGPLVAGIAVLLLVVVVETVAFAALVPTWAWFGLAGAVLIAAAVLIERSGMSPGGAVERMRDLVRDGADRE